MEIINLAKKEKIDKEKILKWEDKTKAGLDKNWKIGIIIFSIISFSFFIWQKNYFGALLILIICFIIFFLPKKKRNETFLISKEGVVIENEIFPYKNLKSFWIFDDSYELYLKSKKSYLPYIIVKLPENSFDEIEKMLLSFLPKEEATRSIFDFIAKKIGL